MPYKIHPCFASKLSKSKLSKIEQIEQKSVFVPGENEVTEMGKRLVYCKAVNPMQAAYPDAVVAKSLRACCGGRTEKSSNRTKEWQTEMLTPSGENVKSLI